MEKINLVKLLKNCPTGMELYSPLCGDCKLYDVNDYGIRIETPNKDTLISLYHDGRYCSGGEIMIFPKGKTTWEGFVPPCKFKDGDIIVSSLGGIHIMQGSTTSYCHFDRFGLLDKTRTTSVRVERLATEEEKEKLFKAIKDNGYQWNAETKTLEKLVAPKFKAGDRIKDKNNFTYTVLSIEGQRYILDDIPRTRVAFVGQDNYELAPNKFDITTLVPFESKVLVRDGNKEKWKPTFWGFYDNDSAMNYPYECCGTSFAQCIPYEGNEHLLGKTDDCNEYFKTWK